MSVINTNIKALVAQDSMVKVNRSLSTAMERLSTGSRINTAADDAAGLSITTRMDSQVRGLSQAIRNANDGISIVQTTEGALEEVASMLQRMRELSVQSANASNNADDRASLDAEVQQLKTEINRVATTTQFNSMNLLDGSFTGKKLQIGDKGFQTMDINISSVKIADLGLGGVAQGSNTLVSSRVALAAVDAGDIKINGVGLGVIVSGDDLEDIIKNINDRVDNVIASGFNTVVAKEAGTGVLADAKLEIKVTPFGTANATLFKISASDSMEELVDNINREVGGLVTASLDGNRKLVLANNTGVTISVYEVGGTADSYSGGSGFRQGPATGVPDAGGKDTFTGFLKLESRDGSAVRVERGNSNFTSPGALSDLEKLGLRETTRINATDAYTVTGEALTDTGVAATWIKGDLIINGVDIFDPNIATTTFSGKLEAINKFSPQTGVTASAFFEASFDTSKTTFTNTDLIHINGLSVAVGADLAAMVTAVNTLTAKTGLVASADGANLVLKGQNVQVANIAVTATAVGIGGTVAAGVTTPAGGAKYGISAASAAIQKFGAIRLDSVSNTPISIALGGTTTAANHKVQHGLLEANVGAADFDTNAPTLSAIFGSAVSGLNVSTVDSASKAIGITDRALQQVSNLRSELGAVENRLEKTVNNLSNIVTNTAQSRSRIKDTDYAVETTNLAKAQIIQQAATAMLAQANQQPQSVLALLQ